MSSKRHELATSKSAGHLIGRRHVLAGLLAGASATVLAGCGLLDPLKPATPAAGPTGTPSVAAQQSPAATAGRPTPAPAPTIATVAGAADGYLAVAPKAFRVGQRESVSVALFRSHQPAAGDVQLDLLKGGKSVVSVTAKVAGQTSVPLDVPVLAEGDYQLRLQTGSLQATSAVRVEDGTLLFLESDKPVYKPGQTIHLRVLTLDPRLRPVSAEVTVDVADAKGLKIYKKIVSTDAFGMASLDVPLSTEPNLGVWKSTARAGKRTAQLDLRIEKYVLPKYEIKVTLPKEWILASERLVGNVSAEYSYGKPVAGEVEIHASRYVGTWQEYATITRELQATGAGPAASASFDLPPVQYASGVPGAGGLANVSLEVTVREKATGYEEKTTRLVTVAASPITLRLIPESLTFKPGLPVSLLVIAETPDRQPTDARVRLDFSYTKSDFKQTTETQQVTVSRGRALVKITPPTDAVALTLGASEASGKSSTSLALQAGYSPSGAFVHVEQMLDQSAVGSAVGGGAAGLAVGDVARFHVTATKNAGGFYFEVVARGSVVYSDYAKSPDIEVALTPAMAPRARLLVYQIQPSSEVSADYVPFDVAGVYPQKVAASFAREEVKPGEAVDLRIETEGEARVGLAAVDRSVFILAENRLNLQEVFARLEQLYQQPQIELHSLGGATSGPVVGPIGGPVDAPIGIAPPPAVDVAPVAPGPAGRGVMPIAPGFGGSGNLTTRGAQEVFGDAGVVVLSNQQVPAGKEYQSPAGNRALGAAGAVAPMAAAKPAEALPPTAEAAAKSVAQDSAGQLADVQRVRQFFPETWLWETVTTDAAGRATKSVTAPDSITTWMLRAVALSKTAGLGIGEAQLRVLQPFFVQVDLPYSAIRGEELPVKLALYNYQTTAEEFVVELAAEGGWLTLLDAPGQSSLTKTVKVGPNDVGALSFQVRPTGLGVNKLRVTARSRLTTGSPGSADAIIKEMIVEPEGVSRELVENLVLSAPTTRAVTTSARQPAPLLAPAAGSGAAERSTNLPLPGPISIVEGSARTLVTVTGSYLTQTIDGLEGLLRMPFGCGEQNMILFAPNVFVARYLRETGQTKPEVMAKAEHLMLTGYQRELTYRRSDGSFSAFGNSDADGSLWLTAFVLKTFAQAKDLISTDDSVQASGQAWVTQKQKADGSFAPVGFLHHQELMGGAAGESGNLALTAYIAIALRELGEELAAGRAARYLESTLARTSEPYALALGAYALGLAKSQKAGEVLDRLLKLGRESDGGLYWEGGGPDQPVPEGSQPKQKPDQPPINQTRRPSASAAVETAGYALLALLEGGDRLNASRVGRWLVSRRNALGGFDSTQDTIVGLQALARLAADSRSDVDATVTLRAASGGWSKQLRVTPEGADVLQIVEVPAELAGAADDGKLTLDVAGRGQVVFQVVRRFNVPTAADRAQSVFDVKVDYGTDQIEVNDEITIMATVRYTPPEPLPAGMVVIDVAVPTGFAPVDESLTELAKQTAKVKRFDVAGRKVIIYVEDLAPEEQIALRFRARALYPVRAQAVASRAYSYYRPEWQGESLGGGVQVQG